MLPSAEAIKQRLQVEETLVARLRILLDVVERLRAADGSTDSLAAPRRVKEVSRD
jgi:hypothetical protein